LIRSTIIAASILVAWVTSDGILAFTDDPARVPAKYRTIATEGTWEELRARTDKRWTVYPRSQKQ
jgi:hypothetical protein